MNYFNKGKVIIDYPVKQLFGVKMIDNKEEFVFLKSYTGISEQLANPYAEIIYKEFGDGWSFGEWDDGIEEC